MRPEKPVPRLKSPEDLMAVAHGYQGAMTLFTALRLGVFRALAGGPAGAFVIARRVSADPRRLSILLDALSAMGLLVKAGGRYRNGKAASGFLLEGPGSKESILLHQRDCWADWSSLERKIRGGRAARPPGGGFQENFIRGMEDNARERAAAVARAVPLRPGERVLDLGGGPGTYAREWAARYPAADVTLFDTPDTLRVTRKILREKGCLSGIRLHSGDFLADPVGGPYDFIWISHILHAYPESDCLRLLRKARRALLPGGRIAVQEFLLDENKSSPPGPALFSLHMVAVTEGGRAYTAREIRSMLGRAGCGRTAAGRRDARGVGVVWGYAG